jgi:nesprin-1
MKKKNEPAQCFIVITDFMLKNRLLESLAKFQEYEDTLESIMRNLDAFEPLINEEVESPVNLKVAQQQLESSRVRLLH